MRLLGVFCVTEKDRIRKVVFESVCRRSGVYRRTYVLKLIEKNKH